MERGRRPALQHRSGPIWACSCVSGSGRSQEICDLWRHRKLTPTTPGPPHPAAAAGAALSQPFASQGSNVWKERKGYKVRSAISTDRRSKLTLRGETSRPIDWDKMGATYSFIACKEPDVRWGEADGEILYSLHAVQRQQQVFYFPLTLLFASVNFIFSEEEVRWRRIVERPSELNTVRAEELGMFQPESVLFHRNSMRGCIKGECHRCLWQIYSC